MKVEFINPFIASLKHVVASIAQIELQAAKPAIKSDDIACGDVSGLIGMIGPQVKGSMAITFDMALAANIMKSMLGDEPTEVDDGVRDMVGELTNMICAGAKNALNEQNYQFDLASPVIITGAKHLITHKVDGPKIIISFISNKGNAYLEICFDS